MSDVNVVRRNITKLINAGASEGEIDSYIESEGLTLEQVKAGAKQEAPSMTYRPVDTSPLPSPEAPKPVTMGRGAGGFPLQQANYEWQRKAAAAGILTDRPREEGRYGLGYALDPQSPSSLEYISREMSSAANQGVPPPEREMAQIRVGPQTGQTEYYDPESRRYAMYNTPNTELGDVKQNLPLMGQIGAEVGGTVGGGAVGTLASGGVPGPGTAAGGVAGGALAAATTEYARLAWGKYKLGLNKELSNEDILNQAILVGGFSAAGSAGAMALQQAFKSAANVIKNRIVSAKTFSDLITNRAASRETARQVSELAAAGRSGAQPLKLNLAQESGDPEWLQAAHTFEGTPGPKQAAMIADRRAQQDALMAAREGANLNQGTPTSAYNSGQQIQEIPLAAKEGLESDMARFTQQADEQAQQASAAVPTGSQTAAGSQAAGQMVGEKQAFKTWANQESAKVDAAAGNIPISNVNLSSTAKNFNQEMKDAIFPSLQADKRGIVGEEFVKSGEVPEAIKILRESMGITPEVKKKLAPIFDPKTKWTFQQAWDAISTLKDMTRRAQVASTRSTMEPNAATFSRLYKALEADLAESFKDNPAAAQAYDQFRMKYRAQKAILDNGRQEALAVEPDKVFKSVFGAADREANDEIAYFIQGNPQAMLQWRGAIFDNYRQQVIRDGRVNPALHAAWMRKYGDMARPYFSNADFQLLQNANTAENTFIRAQAQEKEVIKEFQKQFSSELADLKPEKIMKYLWGENKVGEINKFNAIASPAQKEALKGAVLKEQEKAFFNTDRQTGHQIMSYVKVDDWINKHSAEIEALFGKKYLSDLKVIREGLRLVQQEAPTMNRAGSSLVSGAAEKFFKTRLGQALSIYFGPLSHTRYAIRRAFGLQDSIKEEVVFNALRDPDLLSELVKLRYISPKSRRAALILGELGGLSLYQEGKEQ